EDGDLAPVERFQEEQGVSERCHLALAEPTEGAELTLRQPSASCLERRDASLGGAVLGLCLVALLLGHLEQGLVVVPLALVALGFLLPYRSFFLRDLKLLLEFRDEGLEGRDSRCEVLSSAYLG